jgi:hypothetical protein
MRMYKGLTLIAAVVITALELLAFTHASEVAPQIARRAAASTQGAPVIGASTGSTSDGGCVSGE